jgi:hypothetical protein
MSREEMNCPDCDHGLAEVDRRRFLKTAGAAAAVVGATPWAAIAKDAVAAPSSPESLVKILYGTLNDHQKKELCFDWDHMDSKRGLLRTRVANNWHITPQVINSDYFTKEQQALTRQIFEGIIQPEWHERIDKQLEDDAGGFGESQNIAIFGNPGDGKFEFVMTGRHMTLRCDGNSADHVAFGGPIFYGHAADGFNEGPTHPGNVFWPQAVAANNVYKVLDGKQQKMALVKQAPREQNSGFRGKGTQFDGIPLSELSADQKEEVQKVLQKLIEPYRQSDRDEVISCLKAQGGIDACSLAFYEQGNLGNDQTWDVWRLEGPSFVWHFRGSPHVHVWVNVADDPSVKLNA